MKNKKTRKIGTGELVGYIISGAVALGGLTLAVLGIIGRNLSNIENPLRQANDKLAEAITLGFQPLGAIILILGVHQCRDYLTCCRQTRRH